MKQHSIGEKKSILMSLSWPSCELWPHGHMYRCFIFFFAFWSVVHMKAVLLVTENETFKVEKIPFSQFSQLDGKNGCF